MIEARDFVERARALGFGTYAGVPCSYLTPFINYVIGDDALRYVASANEGDAVATAAGVALAGGRAAAMMQNSGLGNAVSPLTSLTWTFRLPVLLICTHRGAPGEKDEPQHALMGRITTGLLDAMEVPWRAFPAEAGAIDGVLEEARAFMASERRPFALVMKKGTVAPFALRSGKRPAESREMHGRHEGFERMPAERATRNEALHRIVGRTPEASSAVIATTGYTGRELCALADRPNHFYMVGSMGCASSLGLGVALQAPRREVVVVDGDGAALMRMGNLATVGAYGGDNFTHVVLDDEAYDSTGAQSTVSAGVDFATVAAGCGYRSVLSGDDVALIDEVCGNRALKVRACCT